MKEKIYKIWEMMVYMIYKKKLMHFVIYMKLELHFILELLKIIKKKNQII